MNSIIHLHGVSAELGVSPGMELTRMIPEKIQGVTISYDWRTLSRAVSDDPERNGISRLDEMMSGAVRSILDRVACFLYCFLYNIYVVADLSV